MGHSVVASLDYGGQKYAKVVSSLSIKKSRRDELLTQQSLFLTKILWFMLCFWLTKSIKENTTFVQHSSRSGLFSDTVVCLCLFAEIVFQSRTWKQVQRWPVSLLPTFDCISSFCSFIYVRVKAAHSCAVNSSCAAIVTVSQKVCVKKPEGNKPPPLLQIDVI